MKWKGERMLRLGKERITNEPVLSEPPWLNAMIRIEILMPVSEGRECWFVSEMVVREMLEKLTFISSDVWMS